MAFTVKIQLIFLEYIFINKALPASKSVRWQNFMGKNIKDN